jgi:formylglycine-generating enzyme required for sulfatase activity
LEPRKKWLARLPDWPQEEADLVPITVVLRDFARWLPSKAKKAEPRHLWNFIVDRLKAQNLAFVAKPLLERLEHGGAILLLDGLDEIPTQRQRTFIRDAVAAFARRYSQCRFLVTCRTFSYQDPGWQLSDFQSFTLASFSAEQIDSFITAWHSELARLGTIKPGAIEGASRQLQAAVRRPDLWRLASNPLLLTVMALVHTHKGRLPEARALLYEETIDILLWRWEQVKASGEDEASLLRQLLVQANRTDVDLKRALWRLAFEAHREGGTTDTEAVADIGESQLNKALVELHPDRSRDWAHQVVEVMKLRAGLVLERVPEVYTFPHRTFQEYLAGAHLSIQPDFAQQGSHMAAEGTFWHQVVLLAVGRLVYLNGETAKPLALVAELCPATVVDAEVSWRKAWLAGEALLEMGLNRVDESALGRELAVRVRGRLVQLIQGGHLSPVECAAAGNALATMGDPRFRVDAWFLPREPLLGFVEVPAGSFPMGSDKARDVDAYDDEPPQDEVTLPRYFIGRYPVTVGQFQAFVEASGDRPEDEDALRGLANHPVVRVSWHEARRYCDWLTQQLRAWEGTPEPLASLLRHKAWQVLLPSEAEWEKAARGTAGRLYPWGNEPASNRANYADTGINTISAVGCFPAGASPYGVQDMSGNVWEWTRSLWGEYCSPGDVQVHARREDVQAPDDQDRVLRGGAFDHNRRHVRCAYRNRYNPVSRNLSIGFRVVVLPTM